MAAVNVLLVSAVDPVDPVDCKPTRAEILRGIVTEKLSTAALEILAVVERTVAGYEEEAAGLRLEVDRQRRQLQALLQPRVALCRIEEPACEEEEEEAGGGELPEEEQQHTNAEDSGSRDVSGHVEEDEGEDVEEESAEEPVQNTSLDQEDLRDPEYQTATRGQSVKMKGRRRDLLKLRVCLLQDHTNVLKMGVLKSPVNELKCPRGLREPDFLNLLRSTFPQVTGQFDVFTVDATRKLTPLQLQTLTPEEIQRSIKSTGKGRSALYIRAQKAEKSVINTEQLPPPESEDETTSDAGNADSVDTNRVDRRSNNSRRQQQIETAEDGEQRGLSDDFSALSPAESDGDNEEDEEEEVEKDGRDDDWKPDRKEEELSDSEAEANSSKTARRRRRVDHSGVKTKRRKQMLSSLKAATDGGDAPSCKVCGALHRSKTMLIKHALSHVDDSERRCGVCGEHSESAEDLRSHLESHQKTHSCNICGKSFLTVGSLERHATLHTGEKPYKCDICHKAYAHKAGLRNHGWEHVEDKPHKCDLCSRSFAFKQQLRVHSSSHTGEKPYRCDVCGKCVADLRALSRHKLGHIGEKRYACQVCGKRFLIPAKVKEHAKIHTTRDRTYLCDVCCKMFHTRGQLKVHMKTHSEEKIMCSECGKGLSGRGALRRHMMIHTGERPYECSKCGRTFNTQSILREHLKTHSDVKQFVCGVCGKACARKYYLTVHMRTHNGEKPYQCSLCDKAFTQSHCLKTHMRSHQGKETSELDGLKS